MAAGSLVVGLSFLTRQPEHVRVTAAVVGFFVVLTGPVVTLLGLRQPLAEDLYLGVRKDALVLALGRQGAEPQDLPWEDLEHCAFDEARDILVLRRRDGTTVEIPHHFAGIATGVLAKRLDELRRKATFRLL